MPERKVKAKARPLAALARVLLVLAACPPLAACLFSEGARSSAIFSPQPAPAAVAQLPPAAPLPPYGPLPYEPLETSVPESGLAEAAETAAAFPPAEALPLQAFSGGLIDQALFASLAGRLVTAQAGGHLLAAYGLTSSALDEPDPEAEPFAEAEALPALAGLSPAPPSPNTALSDSAPSAGEPAPPVPNQAALRGDRAAKQPGARTKSLLTTAYEQTGRHYKRGGSNPVAGFDAAGYTHWVFAREGLALPKTSAGLAAAGTKVTRENLRPGDVLIYRNQADQADGWHVGIYSGQGNFLHASPKAGVVTETDAFGPQYAPYFQGGRRFFDDPEAAPLPDTYKTAAASTAVKLALTELGPEDKVKKPASRATPRAAKKSKAKKAAKK